MSLHLLRGFRRWGAYAARESLIIPILAVELVVVVVVPPWGDFPLNDDWMYAAMVRTLVTEHCYKHHPFSDPIAVAQVAWGALFCGVFGVSYVALRASTLVLAVLGGWAVAKSAVTLGFSRRVGLLCALLMLSNPIYMNLSYTFMTDVPFFALTALSMLYYLRSLDGDRLRDLFLGSLFGALASLVRQFGLSIGITYLLAAVLVRRKHARVAPGRGLAAFGLPWLAAAAVFTLWRLVWAGEVPLRLHFSEHPAVLRILGASAYAVIVVAAMGLFLLPLTWLRIAPLLARQERWPWRRWVWLAVFGLAAAFVFGVIWKQPLPVPGNILNRVGTGVLNIGDTFPNAEDWQAPRRAGWIIATVLGVMSGAILLADVLSTGLIRPLRQAIGTPPPSPQAGDGAECLAVAAQRLFLFTWGAAVFALSYSPFVRFVFDRYTLPVLAPFALLYAAHLPSAPPPSTTLYSRTLAQRLAKAAAAACVALLFLFSLAGVHDYLALNHARWQALDYLRDDLGVPPEHIDGGFEFNGEYTSQSFVERTGLRYFWQCHDALQWFVLDDAFRVWLTPQAGYQTIKRFPFFLWVGWRQHDVLVLQRMAS